MSVSQIACVFVSYKHYVAGRACGSDATHRLNDEDLCRDHWLYNSSAYPVCGACGLSKYADVRVIQREHTCYEGDQGWDCMHFENDNEHCECESSALEAFEITTRVEVIVDGACADCEYENEADVIRDGVLWCYDCVRDQEASDAYYKDMMDASGQY
jgi:hypothetical protein